jgi:hypothetical protein
MRSNHTKAQLAAAAALIAAVLWPAAASAQTEAEVKAAQQRWAHEPSVSDTVQKSLKYFRVNPEAFDGLRESARNRALLPLVAAGYRYDDDQQARFQEQTITDPHEQDENINRTINSATIGTVWDLRELVFNPAEVQVYGLIGVQRDLMLEVTRTYYLRRQLMLRLSLRPPDDALARAVLKLRIDEFTAILDVLTGGWYSEQSERNARKMNGVDSRR